jgi:hypothetical protein
MDAVMKIEEGIEWGPEDEQRLRQYAKGLHSASHARLTDELRWLNGYIERLHEQVELCEHQLQNMHPEINRGTLVRLRQALHRNQQQLEAAMQELYQRHSLNLPVVAIPENTLQEAAHLRTAGGTK